MRDNGSRSCHGSAIFSNSPAKVFRQPFHGSFSYGFGAAMPAGAPPANQMRRTKAAAAEIQRWRQRFSCTARLTSDTGISTAPLLRRRPAPITPLATLETVRPATVPALTVIRTIETGDRSRPSTVPKEESGCAAEAFADRPRRDLVPATVSTIAGTFRKSVRVDQGARLHVFASRDAALGTECRGQVVQ